MKYLMAIDAGTGSIRAVIFDTKGNQISMGSSRNGPTIEEQEGVENSMSFDCDKQLELSAKLVLQNAIKKANIDSKRDIKY